MPLVRGDQADDTWVKLPAGFSLKPQPLVLRRRTCWGRISPGPRRPRLGCLLAHYVPTKGQGLAGYTSLGFEPSFVQKKDSASK